MRVQVRVLSVCRSGSSAALRQIHGGRYALCLQLRLAAEHFLAAGAFLRLKRLLGNRGTESRRGCALALRVLACLVTPAFGHQ